VGRLWNRKTPDARGIINIVCVASAQFVLSVVFFEPMERGTMAKKAKRREWTKSDVKELKTMARNKTPAPKIARALKRTVGATRQKALALGVSLNSRA
jgi:hypothetical protein